MKPVIALDMDDVLVGFIRSFILFYNHKYGTSVRFEDCFSYALEKVFGGSVEEINKCIVDFYHSDAHDNIEAEEGAVEAIEELRHSFNLPIITSRPHAIRLKTEQLRDRHFGRHLTDLHCVNTYVSCESGPETRRRCKADVCHELGVKLLIDDSLSNVSVVADSGIPVIMPDKPWNQGYGHKRVVRVSSWPEALEIIRGVKEWK